MTTINYQFCVVGCVWYQLFPADVTDQQTLGHEHPHSYTGMAAGCHTLREHVLTLTANYDVSSLVLTREQPSLSHVGLGPACCCCLLLILMTAAKWH